MTATSRTHVRTRHGAIGILTRNGRMLLVRRAAGIVKGGFWCFPGGHVEPGETSRRTVQRELAEELGIRVVVEQRVGSVHLPDSGYVLAAWRVRQESGPFRSAAREIAETRWLSPDGIRAVRPGLPSNNDVLRLLGV